MNGGELVAEVLYRNGVRFLFTLCGGHISPILVACKRRGIRIVDVRDEATAAFAADAMARLTGTIGVVAVTAGPGVTNTITALQNARMAESPVLVLGGATATMLKGRGSLQDIEQLPIVSSITKFASSAKSVRALVRAIETAIATATKGVPGPVFVECPIDLLYDEATVREWYAKEVGGGKGVQGKAIELFVKQHLWRQFAGVDGLQLAGPAEATFPEASASKVDEVAAMIAAAERPVLVIGSQTMLEPREVDALAGAIRRLGIPVFLGGVARGLLGRHDGLQFRHQRGSALKSADLVIVAGFPLDFRLGYGRAIASKAKLVTINRDSATTSKNRRPALGVVGDPGRFLRALAHKAVAQGTRWSAWFDKLREAEAGRDAEIVRQAEVVDPEFVNPLTVCRGMEEAIGDNAVLVVDGGDFVATASYVVRPRQPMSWLDPGVYGTLGVGAGFALAAGCARAGAEVWLIWGDGASAYSLAEIDTFTRHKIPVICVIGNNGSWAQIARDQVEILGDDVGTTLVRNDYDRVAEGFGGKALRIDRVDQITAVFAEAKRLWGEGNTVLVDCRIGQTEFRKGSISM